jgi:hypothetical protein
VKVKTKKVYYCDFCKKHGLSRVAMEKHECHCTLNPERICRWSLAAYLPSPPPRHTMRRGVVRWLKMNVPVTDDVLAKLREYVVNCPACMLAVIRQAELDRFHHFDASCAWDYQQEVERYREDERDHWQSEEYRQMMAELY